MVILEICGSNKLGYVNFIQDKSTFARLKKCKHWFSYCSKIILNDYTKEICAKQVANQSDFLKAFLHLEPLLLPYSEHRKLSKTWFSNTCSNCR